MESSCVLEFWILAVFFSAIVVGMGDLLDVIWPCSVCLNDDC